MPGRHGGTANARYLFNGMEQDPEMKGNGNSYDFGARMYDPRTVRWASRDAEEIRKPNLSPYQAFRNNPILFIDPDGNDEFLSLRITDKRTGKIYIVRSNEVFSKTFRAGAVERQANGKLAQAFYDYRTIANVTIDENGEAHYTGYDQHTIKDYVRAHNVFDLGGLIYKEGTVVTPFAYWDYTGKGGKQRGGVTLYTKEGGSSPTRQVAHFPSDMLDAEDLIDLVGGMKGSKNSAKWEKYKDIFDGVSKGDDAADKLTGDNMSTDLIPGNEQTMSNTTIWIMQDDGRYQGNVFPASDTERVEGDTLVGWPPLKDKTITPEGDTLQGTPSENKLE